MKLRKEMIQYLAERLSKELVEKGYLHDSVGEGDLRERIQRAITEDLMVEDKLNEEVRQILRAHAKDLDERHVDYSKMFQLVKMKLVRERGLIL